MLWIRPILLISVLGGLEPVFEALLASSRKLSRKIILNSGGYGGSWNSCLDFLGPEKVPMLDISAGKKMKMSCILFSVVLKTMSVFKYMAINQYWWKDITLTVWQFKITVVLNTVIAEIPALMTENQQKIFHLTLISCFVIKNVLKGRKW